VDNLRQRKIAAQALEALRLRREREREALTEEEYLSALAALRGAVAPEDTESRPRLMGALEALKLRRPSEKIRPAAPEPPSQVHSQTNLDVPPDAPAPAAAPQRPPGPPIILTETGSERFLSMKCPLCSASVRIFDQTRELSCSDCGVDISVERKDCTIALRLIDLSSPTDPASLKAAKKDDLKTLQAEAAMITTVKRIAGIFGLLLGGTFGYIGFLDMKAQDAVMGVSILVCAAALLGTVFFITRHTNRVRAQLAERIRAMRDTDEGVQDIV
jgi:hypothetical protein